MTTGPTLVIQTAFLGDLVLTTPLLGALAQRHGPVDLVTTPQAAPVLEGHPALRRIIPFDKRGRDRGPGGTLRLAGRLRHNGYARAYLPHRSWRSAALALLARIPERIGFADSPARLSYTARVARDRTAHETDRLLALAGETSPPGDPTAGPVPDLGLSEVEHGAAAEWLADHGIAGDFVALAPGSVWGTKRWPEFGGLAAALPHPVVVIGGAAERDAARDLVARACAGAVSAAGETPLRISAAIIERSRVLVTNDSAPLHLAAAVGTPVVAIFGPTVPAFGFGPRGPHDVIVERSDLACRPCSPHGPRTCPLGHHHCMKEIPVTEVARAVEQVWRAAPSGRNE